MGERACREILTDLKVPERDIPRLSRYMAGDAGRRARATLSRAGKLEAYAHHVRILRLVERYTILELLDGDLIEHTQLLTRAVHEFPNDQNMRNLLNMLQELPDNCSLAKQREIEDRILRHDERITQANHMRVQLRAVRQHFIHRLNQAEDDLVLVVQGRNQYNHHYEMDPGAGN